jgi:ATP-dependent DNA helicase RecQ
VEAYLQESGRAGRDGLPSKAVLLWGPDDALAMRRARRDADRKRLETLLAYARNTTDCRREALLALLDYRGSGDKPESECCDVCCGRARAALREEESVIAFFRKNRRAYTLEEALPVLSGAAMLRWSEEDARKTILRLLGAGSLRRLSRFPWKNKIEAAIPPAPVRRYPRFPRLLSLFSLFWAF